MKLSQHETFKNIYTLLGNPGFFVFSTNTTHPEFDFEKAFTTYQFVFIIVFYKDNELLITEAMRQKMQDAATVRGIFWVDQLYVSPMNKCPSISFSDTTQTLNFSNMSFGKDSTGTGSRIILRSDGASTAAFNAADDIIIFTVNGTKKYKIFAASGQENDFVKYAIPLRHQDQLFGFTSKATNNNTGYLCFHVIQKPVGGIQPKTALLLLGSQGTNALHSYHYFEEESYGTNIDVVALINPCQQENFNNDAAWKFSSYMELFMREKANTNFLDELGNNFCVPKDSSLVSRLAFVNPNEADSAAPNFFFTPKAGQTLDLEAEGQYMLIGSSGTERQDKTKLIFEEFDDVLFRENPDGSVGNTNYAGSVTSIAVSQPSAAAPLKYYIDSERKSLFVNNGHSNAGQINNLEISYNAIEVGEIKENEKVPFIPTLSFKQGPNLGELEKLLVRNRLKHHVKKEENAGLLENEKFVTPQGFVRNGQRLSFIRPSDMNIGNTTRSLQFDVENVSMTSDFNLSISKEDVFMVLKPSMLKNPEKFKVTFNVSSFIIDLLEFNGSEIKRDDTYIIFKFSQHSFASLLDDPTKWSNFGVYKPTSAQAAYLSKDIKEKIKFPKSEDYKYFNETILKDPNWSGVLILNIPIGSGKNLPSIFDGLAGSQELEENTPPPPPDFKNPKLKPVLML